MAPSALETCLSNLSIFSFSWPSLCFVEACVRTERGAAVGSKECSRNGRWRTPRRELTSKALRKSVSWKSDSLIWSIVFLCEEAVGRGAAAQNLVADR